MVAGGWALAINVALAGGGEELADLAARFQEYGLPNVSTATWVRMQACWTPRIEDPLPDDWNASGNAWLLSETRDEVGRPVRCTVMAEGARIADVAEREVLSRQPVKAVDPLAPPVAPVPGDNGYWRAGDPGRDAKKIQRYLETTAWSHGYGGDETQLGRQALLAVALWQRGDTTNAVALYKALTAHAGGATNVAAAALNLLADSQYGNLYAEFRRDTDWTAFRDGLRALLARYPEGWHMAPVMQLLLAKVEARIAQPAPVDSTDMTETDLRQAAAMLELRAIRARRTNYSDPQVLWLVPSAWVDRAPRPLDAELEIRARGIEAMPFLLKLVPDDALTTVPCESVTRDRWYRVRLDPTLLDRLKPGPDRDQWIRKIFDDIDRPATRGEVALAWLREMMPETWQDEYGREEGQKLTDALQNFYQQNHGKTDDELAVAILPGKYSSFNKLAQDDLLARAQATSIPALEDFLTSEKPAKMKPDEGERGLQLDAREELLLRYAFLRGAESKPVLGKFADLLEKTGKDPELVEALKHFPFGASVADLLRSTGGSQDGTGRRLLVAKMDATPLAECVDSVLAGAVASTNPAVRANLADLLRRRAGDRPEAELRATDHAAEWETLIADESFATGYYSDPIVVCDRFLALNENLYGGAWEKVDSDAEHDWQEGARGEMTAKWFLEKQGAPGRAWLRERVRQRLAGTPEANLPPYPVAQIVPAESRLADLRSRFVDVTNRSAAVQAAAELKPEESAALAVLLQADAEINARLSALANRIEKVTVTGDASEQGRQLQAWQGKLPAPELLDAMRQIVEEAVRGGKSATAKLSRKAGFGGCELSLDIGPPKPVKDGDKTVSEVEVGYSGLVCGPDIFGSANWRLAPPPEGERYCWPLQTSDTYDLQLFDQAQKKLLDPAVPASETVFAVFQTRGEKP